MAELPIPPAEELRQFLDYDPKTGLMVWKTLSPSDFIPSKNRTPEHLSALWNANRAGKPAGSRQCDGRIRVRVMGKSYYAHRLIWAIFYGSPPSQWIDHLNGDPSDNRIENLRDVAPCVNSRNKVTSVRSATGVRGVYRRGNRYRVMARRKGKMIDIGWAKTLEEAKSLRTDFDILNGFTARHIAE